VLTGLLSLPIMNSPRYRDNSLLHHLELKNSTHWKKLTFYTYSLKEQDNVPAPNSGYRMGIRAYSGCWFEHTASPVRAGQAVRFGFVARR